MPFFSPYIVLLGIPASIVGIIAGSYGFFQMVLRIPISIGGSIKGNHKSIIAWGLVAVILSCVFPLLSESWIIFLMTRVFAGIATSTWVSYSAYLLEGSGTTANQQMGKLIAANTGGICIAQIVGTVIYDFVGIKILFLISVCTASAGLFLFLRFSAFRNNTHGEIRPSFSIQSLSIVLHNKNLWVCSILMALSNWVIFSTNYNFTGVYAQAALSAGAVHLGLIAMVYQFGSVITSLVFSRIGGKPLPEKNMLFLSFILIAILCGITTFCSLPILITVQFFAGINTAVVRVILFAKAGSNLSDDQQLMSMGVFQSVYSIGMTAGPAMAGFLFEYSNENNLFVFFVLAGFGVAGAILTLVGFKPHERIN